MDKDTTCFNAGLENMVQANNSEGFALSAKEERELFALGEQLRSRWGSYAVHAIQLSRRIYGRNTPLRHACHFRSTIQVDGQRQRPYIVTAKPQTRLPKPLPREQAHPEEDRHFETRAEELRNARSKPWSVPSTPRSPSSLLSCRTAYDSPIPHCVSLTRNCVAQSNTSLFSLVIGSTIGLLQSPLHAAKAHMFVYLYSVLRL
ncbi:hypothetical protein EDD85DRAFT_252598 [Armillaria nabsnona]|nr:hypothetical protein EDD85DRAFT_252598 [Armillaria nabsnona]